MSQSESPASKQRQRLPPVGTLAITDTGAVRAGHFDDVFFSAADGYAETRLTFLQNGDVRNAWQGRRLFSIAETGLGTGLNFLATWEEWRASRLPGSILHYISVEGYLLDATAAAQALSAWPHLTPLASRLLDRWPVRARGPQRIWFEDEDLCLTVLIDEALPALQGLDQPVDAWFLDGFAPSRNSDMWRPEVLNEIGRLSRPGTTLATYTVAGAVRRGLEAVGFQLERHPGHGSKRERLTGMFAGAATPQSGPYPRPQPASPTSAIVIGGGIAGASAAHALARRGLSVTVLDDDIGGIRKASGNEAALVMPRLDRGDTAAADFFRSAWIAALSLYRSLPPGVFESVGVVERPLGTDEQAGMADLLADPPLPAEHLGASENGGLLHKGAGWVRPKKVLEQLLAGITVRQATVTSLRRVGARWEVIDAGGTGITADLVVHASGTALAGLPETAWLPLAASRGQVTVAPLSGELPHHALAGGPYALPMDNRLMFGATFDPVALDAEPGPPSAEDHQRNHALLAELDSDLARRVTLSEATGRVALRATTPDRLPVAGPIPAFAAYLEHYAPLATGGKVPSDAPPPCLEGLYVLGGLGARGFTSAPLCAEVVATTALGEPLPVTRRVWEALQPARFLLRGLKRGQFRPPLRAD